MTDFWWGTGASSTQCEGAAPESDWRAWERAGKVPPSGTGNDFATRYAEDFANLAALGLNHHRLSIEWARIEPREGQRDSAAIEHYQELLRVAVGLGISPWVCLHHFSLPGWFSADEGGLLDEHARTYYWPRHVDFIAETFGDLVFGWKPVNEPVAYASLGWLDGTFPPGRSGNIQKFAQALEAIHLANFEAALRLRQSGQPVATIMNLQPVFAAQRTPDCEAMAKLVDEVVWGSWIRAVREGTLQIPGRGPVLRPEFERAFDIIGFSYYNALAVDADGQFSPYPADARVGPLGYAPWTEGLGLVLHRLAEALPTHPLLVCEFGVGTDDDAWREELLREALAQVADARQGGIDLRGFFHWTGVDNYEWQHGFTVPFGLFDRDRTARPSAELLRRAAQG